MAGLIDDDGPAPVLVDARQSLGPAKIDGLFPGEAEFRRTLQASVFLLAVAGLVASFGLHADSVAADLRGDPRRSRSSVRRPFRDRAAGRR